MACKIGVKAILRNGIKKSVVKGRCDTENSTHSLKMYGVEFIQPGEGGG